MMFRFICFIFICFIIGLVIFSGCAPLPPYVQPDNQLEQRLAAHIYFLTSDSLEGREAGTESEYKSALYLAEQLRNMGILPYADCDGTANTDSLCYFMPFEAIRTSVFRQSSIVLADTNGNGQLAFFWGDDFGNSQNLVFPCSLMAPVVFAGYGITAPEFNYDDYRNLDVRGKIVMVFDGEPHSEDDNFFYGPIVSSYSSALFYKRHRAKELGARGIVVLTMDKLREEWRTLREYFKSPVMDFHSTISDTSDPNDRIPFVYATPSLFQAFLNSGGYSIDSLEFLHANGLTLPVFDIPSIQMRLQIAMKKTPVRSLNVVGYIEGTDPMLKRSFVSLGAHFDHLGKNDKGEIYYGADDNASGVSAVLETARLLKLHPPKRSVLIIFHGAEEKGLLGSEYLTLPETTKPFVLDSIIAYLNFDMVGRGHTDSIFVIGSDRISHEMKKLIQSVNRRPRLFYFDYAFDRDDDPHYYYYRSDHYHYARAGIPIAFFFDGMTEDYHRPTDTPDKINFAKLRKIVELGYRILYTAGNRPDAFKPRTDPAE